jgi:hypothetical protein
MVATIERGSERVSNVRERMSQLGSERVSIARERMSQRFRSVSRKIVLGGSRIANFWISPLQRFNRSTLKRILGAP